MSHRTIDHYGNEMYGEGFDGAPVESDPMGNNMGLSTPYVELQEPPEHHIPTLFPLDGESPTYVNGQRLSCTLDGLSIGCSRARELLDHGAATFDILTHTASGFRWQQAQIEGHGLGLFSLDSIYSRTQPDRTYFVPAGQSFDGHLVYQGGTVDFSWSPSGQSVQAQTPNDQHKTANTGKPKKLKRPRITIGQAIQDCINSLWGGLVKLNSIVPSKSGRNGTANITYQDPNGINQTASVTNDVTYSAYTLGYVYAASEAGTFNIPQGFTEPTGITLEGIKTIDGVPYTFSSLKNFTASDRSVGEGKYPLLEAQIGAFYDTQIHELDNSIANLTGIYLGVAGSIDRDSGWQLESCVAKKVTGEHWSLNPDQTLWMYHKK